MNKIFKLITAVLLIVSVGTFSACKKTFDNPPGPTDPNIVPTKSIEQLKTLHTNFGAYDLITDDIIISGIVVANDESGNFYKQLFVQDSTGAIQILIDANSLYGTYPVGRRVFIKCKGLTLSDANSTMVLGVRAIISGSPSIEGIPGAVVSQYIIGGSLNNPVVPITVTLGDLGTNLNDKYINALIRLEGYEFVSADISKTYSDTSAYKITANRIIQPVVPGCNPPLNSKLTVRNSAYSNFAALPIPDGSGDITAIYTVYRFDVNSSPTRQLIIRDTADVQFNGARCGAPPPGSIVLLNETFESQTASTAVSIPGWNNLAEAGSRTYTAKLFSSNLYAEMSAFTSNSASNKTWLVTSGINLDNTTAENLSFVTTQGHAGTGGSTAALLKVLISNNYTGTGNPWTGGVTWTDVTSQAVLSPGQASGFPSGSTPSGNISLNSYTGTVYIAFVYEGGDPTGTANDKTSTWQIDNVMVLGL